jgi:TPR repeat protein
MRTQLIAVVFGLVASLAVSTANATTGQRLALIIGNSNYVELSALRNPENDARAMAETLEQLQFDVILTVDADRRGMARAIRDFGRRLTAAGRDAVGLFFYAGHGVQARNTNYLMPLHAEVVGEADLEIEAVDTNWVLSQMEEAGNALNIIILDACRNNPFRGSFRSAERGLARINAPTGSIVAYSAAPGQVAADGDGENSPYTAALIQAMQEPGVELSRVFRQVRVEVTSETGGDQTPWEEQSLTGDFFFVDQETQVAAIAPETAPAAQPQAPATQAPAATAPFDNSNVEILFWNTVMNSDNPDELQAYIDAYPNGTFRGLAEIRIARLHASLEQEPDPANSTPAQAPPASDGASGPGWIGIRGTEMSEGILVAVVLDGGPAEVAGLQVGDVIVKLDGRDVRGAEAFEAAITALGSGAVVSAEIVRYGRAMTVRATLGNSQSSVAQQATRAWEQRVAQAEAAYQEGEQYYYGDGVRADQAEAVRFYRQAAEVGHVEAQYALAWSYKYAEGVAQNDQESFRWFMAAAAQGNSDAQSMIGLAYELGEGVPLSHTDAVIWYRRGALQGNPTAQFNLGNLYNEGLGVSQDQVTAFMWYTTAATNGQPDTEDILAEVRRALKSADIAAGEEASRRCINSNYEQCTIASAPGWLGAQLTETAEGLLVAAVLGGGPAEAAGLQTGDVIYKLDGRNVQGVEAFVSAIAALGNGTLTTADIYRYGRPMTVRVTLGDREGPASHRAAQAWEEQVGNADAAYLRGEQFYYGEEVAADHVEAVRHYRQAAEVGHVEAQYALAWSYKYAEGVAQNDQESFRWFLAAAAQGNSDAQSMIGLAYELGEGVPLSHTDAVIWYRRGALQGNPTAQFNLGNMYNEGLGLSQDQATAYMWYTTAATNGQPDTEDILAEVRRALKSAEISAGEEASRRCIDSNYRQCGDISG